jgi:hypothetical protein
VTDGGATGPDGSFTLNVTPSTPGTWRASVQLLNGPSAACTVPVLIAVTLTAACPSDVPLGPGGSGTAEITGTTAPNLSGDTVTVSASGGGGTRSATALVAANGTYGAEIPVSLADISAPVSAHASFAGDATHQTAASNACEFAVG